MNTGQTKYSTMTTQIDKTEKRLRTQLHAITARLRMSDEEYRTMLYDTYRVESCVDLNAHQLIDLIHTLQQHLPQDTALEKARRRCAASIMAYFCAIDYHPDNMTAAVRATACRAAEVDNWFRIGKEKLTAVGAAFSKKARVTGNVKNIRINSMVEQGTRSKEERQITSELLLASARYGMAEA